MLQLMPLEQTVAGKELIQIGRQEGRHEGKLIGKIQLMQRLLKKPVSSEEELYQLSDDALERLLGQLEAYVFKSS